MARRYRARNDENHSLVFVAHSADMHQDKPTPSCPVKVVKVTYNSDNLAAPRLMVQHPGCNTADITRDMSVQDVLKMMSHKFDQTNIHAMGCHRFEQLSLEAARDPRVWATQAAAAMVSA